MRRTTTGVVALVATLAIGGTTLAVANDTEPTGECSSATRERTQRQVVAYSGERRMVRYRAKVVTVETCPDQPVSRTVTYGAWSVPVPR